MDTRSLQQSSIGIKLPSIFRIGIFVSFLVNIIVMAQTGGLNGNVTVGVPYTMDGVYVDEI